MYMNCTVNLVGVRFFTLKEMLLILLLLVSASSCRDYSH